MPITLSIVDARGRAAGRPAADGHRPARPLRRRRPGSARGHLPGPVRRGALSRRAARLARGRRRSSASRSPSAARSSRPDPPRAILVARPLEPAPLLRAARPLGGSARGPGAAPKPRPGRRDAPPRARAPARACGRPEEALRGARVLRQRRGGRRTRRCHAARSRLVRGARSRGRWSASSETRRRMFTLEEARALMPQVQGAHRRRRSSATRSFRASLEDARLEVVREPGPRRSGRSASRSRVSGSWTSTPAPGTTAGSIPSAALNHFHSYEEGFAGRLPLA